MPGRLFLTRPMAELSSALNVPLPIPAEEPPRANISPGQDILVLTRKGMTRMRWGMIPVGRVNARGRPVLQNIVNARGETVFGKSAFRGVGRALVPADGWYEWTGKKGRKQPWRIWPKDGAPLTFAAITDIWTAPGGTKLPQVALVTCDPSGDVKDLHDRMGVIVAAEDRATWLDGHDAQAHALVRPWPDGRLIHEKADMVDFSGP
ncbi:SOS response-associated peptidase [Actibacterium sp. 188UL27-1]|uniref:SOS response-associated peptidase n=1 Tax=Actibacterium sp. 188UL27-1 TaxID=2786961 RepID=UPI00195DD2D6|nr:SOS response-associated peptidase [Actibacterium sp. 188UL27-1]MBM7068729.1 SOS response-associated peptidase [Actibacterium sp. 188UL27-1]